MVLKKLAAVAKSRVYIYTYVYILIYSIVFRSAISSRASMYILCANVHLKHVFRVHSAAEKS